MWKYFQKDIFKENESIIVMKKKARKQDIYHTHDFIEMVYIYSGKGKQFVNECEYDVTRGCILFINCGEVHYFTTTENMYYIEVLIKPEILSNKAINFQNKSGILSLTEFESMHHPLLPSPFFIITGNDLKKAEILFFDMLNEYNTAEFNYENIMEKYLYILLTHIIRNSFYKNLKGRGLSSEVMNYIDNHYNKHISLSSLAKKSFYTPKYFSYIFKKKCKMTLTEYICKKRINEGERLLVETKIPIDGISRIVGWENSTVFYHNFKKEYNITPHAYRKKYCNN